MDEGPFGTGRLAVLGGDKRELLIARWFADRGYDVSMFGTRPDPNSEAMVRASAAAAVEGASVIVAPMPGIANGNQLYTPHMPDPIVVDGDLLAAAADGAVFFAGRCTPQMRAAEPAKAIHWFAMGDDDYVQVQHAIPTAEAALALAITQTDETVNGARCLVIGYGRIGCILAADLRGIGGRVTVSARRAEVRARAQAAGHDAIGTDTVEIIEAATAADVIFVTTPARLFTEAVLSRCTSAPLIIDLASPPGGVDHEVAERLGLRIVWARGQADGAAAHAARAQYQFMLNTLSDLTADSPETQGSVL